MPDDALPATRSLSIGVAASPEVLWPIISDPGTPARFSLELQAASFADGNGPQLGAVIEGHNEREGFAWDTSSTVVGCEPPRLFRWATGGAESPSASWWFEVEPSGEGSVLIHGVCFHEGGHPLAPAIAAEPARAHEIVDGRLEDVLESMRRTIEGIASLAERRGAPDA
jgi:hypothetical protein